jgi:hypothetical protein
LPRRAIGYHAANLGEPDPARVDACNADQGDHVQVTEANTNLPPAGASDAPSDSAMLACAADEAKP